ncbi:MAG: DUF5615 family PIN-like protein [Anaerolinea sp.]|nr:DUF5615 family PIN-like protein [Anaerolinea sp.]
MKPRFLLDENVEAVILRQLRRRYPEVEVMAVGDPGTPLLQSKDPSLLDWIAVHRYILVTRDRRSMPDHIAAHYEKGGQLPGVLLIRRQATINQIVESLFLIWASSDLSEYNNTILYIP